MAKKIVPKIDTLTKVKRDFESALDYVRNGYWDKWQDYWSHYNNEDVDKYVGYQGTSKAFDPMTFSTVETILANVYGSKPKFTFSPTVKEQEKDTKILNAQCNYYWEADNMSQKIIPFGRENLITGNSVLWIGWGKDHPVNNHIPVRDCFFDPTARNLEECRYAGYRRLTTLTELKKEKVYNDKTEGWEQKYTNLDNVRTWTGGSNQETDRELKDCYDGSTIDGESKKDQVEVIYICYKDKIIEMANRSEIIRDDDNPFQAEAKTVKVMVKDDTNPDAPPVAKEMQIEAIEPFIPVVLQRNYIDAALLYAKGEIETMASSQGYLNDVIRQKSDNVALNLDEVKLLDPQYADLMPQIISAPGAIIPVPPNALREMPKQDMTASADAEIMRIKQSIRETTGADEVIKGMKAGGDTTATEINAQMNQAGQRFAMKIQGLENEGYKQLATIWFKMTQIFTTGKQVVKITGDEGVKWLEYNPDMFWGSYEPMVQLEAVAKAKDKEKRDAAIQLLTVLRGDPLVNQKELYKKSLTDAFGIDDDEADLLLAQQPQPGMEGMPGGDPGQVVQGQPGMQQAPAGPAPDPTIIQTPGGVPVKGADLVKLYMEAAGDPGLQDQIIQVLGFQPTPDDQTQAFNPKNADMKVNAALKIAQAQHLQEMDAAKHQHEVNKHDHQSGMDRANLLLQAQQQQASQEQAQQQLEQPQEAQVG